MAHLKSYYVMHKNRRVARVDINGKCKIYFKSFMPYDLVLEESEDFDDRFNNLNVFYHWCASRVLTLDRVYAKQILNSVGAKQSATDRDRAQIALSYRCVSLRDVFWVRDVEDNVHFEEVCLFTKSLDSALTDIALRGHQMTVTNTHLLASDLSTAGCYPKAWVRENGRFFLYKDGGQDVVDREVLASRICRCFACPQVLYENTEFEGEPVSASSLMTSIDYSISTYSAYEVYCINREWDALKRIKKLDAHGYYMMNILDYLVGNVDRHWENWGLLVDNKTNRPIRLYDLMDFNCAFQQYDSVDGANCLTSQNRSTTQREAAIEAVRAIGLNQIADVNEGDFKEHEDWLKMYKVRLDILKNAVVQ